MATSLVEILADFNLAVQRHTAKLPNLIPHQIFQLSCMQKKREGYYSHSLFDWYGMGNQLAAAL